MRRLAAILAAALRTARRCFIAIAGWLQRSARGLLTGAALAGLGVGVGWWIHPGAGLVAPSTVVLGCLIWSQMRPMTDVEESA